MSHVLFLLRICSKCNKYDLKVGSTIMGNKAIADTQGRTMIVARNGVPLSSGAAYIAGETLTVYVSSFSLEAIYQATGAATFASGYPCTNANGSPNNRVAATSSQNLGIDLDSSGNYSASLIMPQAGSGSVTVFAAMATGFSAVSIIPNFVLSDPGVVQSAIPSSKPIAIPSSSPSVKPTAQPSFKPNVPSLSPSFNPITPSNSPSVKLNPPSSFPSFKPNVPSNSPSFNPIASTLSPSAKPNAPSLNPTASSFFPTVKPNAAPSPSPSVKPAASSTFPSIKPNVPSTSPTFKSNKPSLSPNIPISSFPPSVQPSFLPCEPLTVDLFYPSLGNIVYPAKLLPFYYGMFTAGAYSKSQLSIQSRMITRVDNSIGSCESGLGVFGIDNNIRINEIDKNHFIQFDFFNITSHYDSISFTIGSTQLGEGYQLYGSNTEGTLGTLFFSSEWDPSGTCPETFPYTFGTEYRYVSITAFDVGVLNGLTANPHANVLVQSVTFACAAI